MNIVKWYKPEEKLPPEGKYVLVQIIDRPWEDSIDPEGCFYNVARLNRCNAHGNNLKPYFWDEFGPGSFFGQEVARWCSIPK